MQWSKESKKAFVQALNIKFLTAKGDYTNLQFDDRGRGQVYMLFPSGKQKDCQEYLEQVTKRYKNAIVSLKNGVFDANNFPFCINPGRFSYSKSKKGIKFKVSLNKGVINNLYYIFINQLLSFEIEDLPNHIELSNNDINKKNILQVGCFL